ncbi:hypothetical protein P170DRAFT_433984 [Aspergillus steynii IBT 23096]|uniref:Uncharacterized protein n=1 Tax=Aspergillus steynii IBT 23096 TaxID=1392250 RepID=A0A2I2GGZ8_9EURO|nr:uncharacterized protein P170DRAFT_433984 [Aspergillus steynii IBT 23096]PLB52142.1 hypothetical protein P170DRAFT_433984 [Aspergillus steynii IBT 23096]
MRGHGCDADRRCAQNLKWRFFGSEVISSLMTRAGLEALLLENEFQGMETSARGLCASG